MRALALAVLTALPGAASAQVADRLADLRLATAVRLALVAEPRTRALDVAVSARDGAVAIEGAVPAALQPLVAEVARGVPGVRRVAGDGLPPAPSPVARPETPRRPADPPRADPPPAEPSEAGPAFHTVAAGDTVFSLARRYGTTVQALLDLNGLDAPDIRVGQRLRVR